MRELITLECTDCKQQNYTTYRAKAAGSTKKLELKKYCRFCRKHTAHKEKK